MNRARTSALFSHLALALAGLALGCAEIDFLPEMPLLLLVYLSLILVSWRTAGRWCLPTWAANGLGLLIAGMGAGWIAARLGDAENNMWLREVPITAAIVPFLGPVLMALLLVRLYRPRTPGDFWVLQGLGLLEVALGCVLTSGTLFGFVLLAYLVVALCALAAHERHRQTTHSAPIGPPVPAWQLRNWMWFGLRWTVAIAFLALPLFLLTPRAEGPEWDPWSRFGLRQTRQTTSNTGFSEEIDLTRSGTLEVDDGVAFTVTVTDRAGEPVRGLSINQRWRGIVLDRYEDGVWRCGLNWSAKSPVYRPAPRFLNQGSDALQLEFRVPGRTGGLFLAEPVPLSQQFGVLPVWPAQSMTREDVTTLFYEIDGTVIPISYLTRSEYRYHQTISPTASRERYRAWRIRDTYLQRLVRVRQTEIETWTRELLLRLATQGGPKLAPLREALQVNSRTGDTLPPTHWETIARLLNNHLALSGEYSYSMSFERGSLAIDPVLDFLINIRQGTCERFATALAVMLRSQGIPTRVIKGFRGAEESGPGVYQIRNNHAHAWVEVLVLTEGDDRLTFDWLLLDPTPDTEATARPVSALSRWWQLQQSGQALWQDLIVGYTASQQADLLDDLFSVERWLTLAPWLAGGLILIVGAWLWRRHLHRWRARIGQAGAGTLYAQLVELLGRHLQLTPRSDETPRELAQRAAEVLARRASLNGLAVVPEQVVALFYETRFGGRTPTEAELTAMRSRLSALETALAS